MIYENRVVFGTGFIGDSINEGTGAAVGTLPAGGVSTVLVRVIGRPGTAWEYTVNCPIA